jgi:hypothetical protein
MTQSIFQDNISWCLRSHLGLDQPCTGWMTSPAHDTSSDWPVAIDFPANAQTAVDVTSSVDGIKSTRADDHRAFY